MKIYTIDESNLKKVLETEKNLVPISISNNRIPNQGEMICYRKLAPSFVMIAALLYRPRTRGNYEYYMKLYQQEILNFLNQKDVIKELKELSDKRDIILVSYKEEELGNFSSRFQLANWLNKVSKETKIKVFDYMKNKPNYKKDESLPKTYCKNLLPR